MAEQAVLEAASEIGPGRPRKWSARYLSALADINSRKARSARQQQNIAFAHKALCVLIDDSPDLPPDGPYAWIACDQPRVQKTSVLAELGRLDDPEDIRAWARTVCEQKMTAKHAAALIRKTRLGVTNNGSAKGLYRLLARAVGDYLACHPEITLEQVCVVLDRLKVAYRQVDATG
jgi:hypothetical protein